jgi:hypothetical protein
MFGLITAGLLGAAGSIAGGLIGNAGQASANQANREIAREQMAFQERMSNTAHQREVDDLRAAGLNPVLSAGGSGASSPSGASIAMQNPNADLARGVENAANSARTYVKDKAALDLVKKQADKAFAEAGNAGLLHEINLGKFNTGPLAEKINAETASAKAIRDQQEAQAKILKMQADFWEQAKAKGYNPAEMDFYMRNLGGLINSAGKLGDISRGMKVSK